MYVSGMSTNKNTLTYEQCCFITINDWPALSNLLGQTNKGYNACTHCFDDLDSIYLKKMSKGRVPWPSSIPSFEPPSKKERESF